MLYIIVVINLYCIFNSFIHLLYIFSHNLAAKLYNQPIINFRYFLSRIKLQLSHLNRFSKTTTMELPNFRSLCGPPARKRAVILLRPYLNGLNRCRSAISLEAEEGEGMTLLALLGTIASLSTKLSKRR